MTDFFIFQYKDSVNLINEEGITVLFVNQKQFDNHKTLIDSLEVFFQSHLLLDRFVILLPEYCSPKLKYYFLEAVFETFSRVPRFDKNYYDNHFYIFNINKLGGFNCSKHFEGLKNSYDSFDFFEFLKRNGSTQIFKKRGGLIESSPDHHFVFPSRKHSEKFIRTGNVLVHSSEIFFLAFQLLDKFQNIDSIYCDTSSINVLPFAVFEMKRRFDEDFESIPINSFESYKVFESLTSSFSRNALVLVSSSTSGNIINRLVESSIALKSQILVLFFLGRKKKFLQFKENIVCDITCSEVDFLNGVEIFKTYENTIKCKLCDNFSTPIEIKGDVFLSVQPKVKSLVLKKSDAPKFLSGFMLKHRCEIESENIFKAYYGYSNNGPLNYEVFIDTSKLIDRVSNNNSTSKFKSKLLRKINTHISAQTKYILHLPDPGSKKLVEFVLANIDFKNIPKIISIEEINEIEDQEGSILIIGSSLVTGRYYLHISRLIRKYKQLGASYLIGVLRSMSQEYNVSTKSNLGQGRDGGQTFPVISIEEIYCSPRMENNYWDAEKDILEKILSALDEDNFSDFADYIKTRLRVLRDSRKNGGLNNNVFLPMYDNNPLRLRKGFVYWNYEVKEKTAFQSQVYFTISTVINHLINQPIDSERTLRQTNYVRNLISPDNFKRFNDGIIQSSILRAGRLENFVYNLDKEESLKMKVMLISMIDAFNDEHGEALPEFILALALKKIRLRRKHLKAIFNEAKLKIKDPILTPFFNETEKILFD